jgi:hypothetical protein
MVEQNRGPDFVTVPEDIDDDDFGRFIPSESRREIERDERLIDAPPEYFVGLDLGQSRDYTALICVRKSISVVDGLPERTRAGQEVYNLLCNHAERFPLGTSYPMIVRAVGELVRRPELIGRPVLSIDRTGVGGAVFDMFRQANLPCSLEGVSITAGREASHVSRGLWNIPKIELISVVQAALSTGRLKFVRTLPHRDTIISELMDYRVTVTANANETIDARSGKHDDLVLALALPVWFASGNYYYSRGCF